MPCEASRKMAKTDSKLPSPRPTHGEQRINCQASWKINHPKIGRKIAAREFLQMKTLQSRSADKQEHANENQEKRNR